MRAGLANLGLVFDSTCAVERASGSAPLTGRGVESLLEDPIFLANSSWLRETCDLPPARVHQFTSSVVSPWKRNNSARPALHDRQTVAGQASRILIHWWKCGGLSCIVAAPGAAVDEAGRERGDVRVAVHTRRKPRGRKSIHNFLSGDLVHVVQAAINRGGARALIACWRQGCPRIGLWGISLGAWLSGLLACEDARLDCAVLMSPVSRMDRVIAELGFGAPIAAVSVVRG